MFDQKDLNQVVKHFFHKYFPKWKYATHGHNLYANLCNQINSTIINGKNP